MDSDFWQDADNRVQRAKDLLRRRRVPEALEELRAAAELDPFNAVHHYELGRCLSLMNRNGEAADAFGRAFETDPREPAYADAYADALLARRRWDEAAEVLRRLTKLLPDDEPALARQVWAYAELGDHERAEEAFYLAQQLADDRPAAFYHVGRSLAQRQRHARARWCFRRAADLAGPGSRFASMAQLRLAESLADEGRLEPARRQYLHALARDGRDVDALLGLGDLLVRMRQHDAAADRIRRAVRLAPDDPRGHFLAGRCYLAVGKLNEAHVALRRVVELEADFPRAHLLLARVAAGHDDSAEVSRACRAEMFRRPDCPQTLRELAGLLMDAGDLEHAAACLRRLVALVPGDPRAWQELGVCECWRGELMQGVIASRRSLKLDPRNLAAANNLALAFLQMRELDAAAKVIADGLAVDPRDRLLRRLKLRLRVLCAVARGRRTVRRLLGREEE